MRTKSLRVQALGWVGLLALAAGLTLSAGCDSLFYYPDRVAYNQPLSAGQKAEEVLFLAADGVVLHWRFIPATAQPVKGTVIHFHGNAQNLTSHYWFVNWMPAAGYNVFQFDYRGYGKSGLYRVKAANADGVVAGAVAKMSDLGPDAACDLAPDREGIFRDACAALSYVAQRQDVDPHKLLGFGQSLGGCVMLDAVAERYPDLLCGAVAESTFRSYREMGRRKAGQSWLLWAFQYPLSWMLVSDGHSPADFVDRLTELPLLAIYGLADDVVPGDQTQLLYDQWKGPKQLATVPNAGHLQARERVGDAAYIRLVDTFFQDCLEGRAKAAAGGGAAAAAAGDNRAAERVGVGASPAQSETGSAVAPSAQSVPPLQ